MEVRTARVDADVTMGRLIGAGCSVGIACPGFFRSLLEHTLNGWVYEACADMEAVDIHVAWDGEGYDIDSVVLVERQRYTDMIAALNEVFLSLSYILTARTPEAVLLHCAAFDDRGRHHLIVGEKGAGKSTLVTGQAVSGARIYADDMVVYFPKTASCMAIGLPMRLRRPVQSPLKEQITPEDFFAGQTLAYSKAGAFDIAPAGQRFELDRILVLEAGGKKRSVSLFRSAKTLQSYKIGSLYTTLKKPEIRMDM